MTIRVGLCSTGSHLRFRWEYLVVIRQVLEGDVFPRIMWEDFMVHASRCTQCRFYVHHLGGMHVPSVTVESFSNDIMKGS